MQAALSFFAGFQSLGASVCAEMLAPPPKCSSRSTVCVPAQRDAGKIDNMRAGSTAGASSRRSANPNLYPEADMLPSVFETDPDRQSEDFHCKMFHFVVKTKNSKNPGRSVQNEMGRRILFGKCNKNIKNHMQNRWNFMDGPKITKNHSHGLPRRYVNIFCQKKNVHASF